MSYFQECWCGSNRVDMNLGRIFEFTPIRNPSNDASKRVSRTVHTMPVLRIQNRRLILSQKSKKGGNMQQSLATRWSKRVKYFKYMIAYGCVWILLVEYEDEGSQRIWHKIRLNHICTCSQCCRSTLANWYSPWQGFTPVSATYRKPWP